MKILFWTSLIIILYVYVVYPFLLILVGLFRTKKVKRGDITPYVTLIISAFNEEGSIREKIDNSLSLDYPEDKLEIMVVSDCSTDNTDDIVREYESRGVVLLRQPERSGKTVGLNSAIKEANGEIIVFTDANALFNPDVIRMLIRNFNDPNVGCVTGESRYVEEKRSVSGSCESLYWNYENFIKSGEGRIDSVVGGDGAIYAIRKELYTPLLNTDISDIVNPLQIIMKGYRNIYEPEAISYEEAAATFGEEFQRKVRITNRAWYSLLRMKGLLNPLKYGFFSLQIISHRVLRWFIPFFLIATFFSNMAVLRDSPIYVLTFIFQICLYSLALAGHLFFRGNKKRKNIVFYVPYYFAMVNLASLIGVTKAFFGKVTVTWQPMRGEDVLEESIKKGNLFLMLMTGVPVIFFIAYLVPEITFWLSMLLVIYVYFGYPVILAIWALLNKNPVIKREILPEVTLLIAAYNEEEVIEEKIKNSLSLDYPRDKLKIVIASDGSDDKTVELVKEYEKDGIILYPYTVRMGKIKALNNTIPRIDTEIIFFSDANTMYQEDAVKKMVRSFYDESVGVVSGNVMLQSDHVGFGGPEKMYWRYEHFIHLKESQCGSMLEADGAMYSIRRALYRPVKDNTILDDFVIPMEIAKQGYRVVYEPEAIGLENTSPSIKAEFLRKIRITAGGIQAIKQREGVPGLKNGVLLFQYISHKFFRWMLPFFMLLLAFSNLFLLERIFYTSTFVLQIAFYVLAVTG
ncbi:MAG: glycosyltransferase family 2 protein, partial [Thermodesulfobacteriota bacterium]